MPDDLWDEGRPWGLAAMCSAATAVTQNTYHRGFAQMYNSCSGSTSHPPYAGFENPLQDTTSSCRTRARRPTVSTRQSDTGYFAPNGGCFGYFPDEWMTFQVRIKTGPRVGDEFVNSYVELWIAREGQPSQQVINWGPYNLTGAAPGENQQFGKIFFPIAISSHRLYLVRRADHLEKQDPGATGSTKRPEAPRNLSVF
jgi:hypothetical protein